MEKTEEGSAADKSVVTPSALPSANNSKVADLACKGSLWLRCDLLVIMVLIICILIDLIRVKPYNTHILINKKSYA
jgi:hypothetical protein